MASRIVIGMSAILLAGCSGSLDPKAMPGSSVGSVTQEVVRAGVERVMEAKGSGLVLAAVLIGAGLALDVPIVAVGTALGAGFLIRDGMAPHSGSNGVF